MENLNAEQVKRALECCSVKRICTDCPYFEKYCKAGALHRLEVDALALINSQEQRIKELTEENERLMRKKTALECVVSTARNQAKADTVRKMHEMIKERCIKGGIYPAFVARTIDQIAKEMLEGDNGIQDK